MSAAMFNTSHSTLSPIGPGIAEQCLNASLPTSALLCQAMCEVTNTSCVPELPKPTLTRVILFWINVYLTPVLIVVGTLGNVLSCVVLMSAPLRRQSSSIYLSCVAIADTGFLLTLLVAWLAWVKVDLINKQGWCQLTVFMAYVSAFISVWSVVSFTAERYIAVWHPFRRQVVCSARRAKGLVVCVTVVGIILYSPSLWTSTILDMYGTRVCAPKPELIHVANAVMNVDTVITLVIPALIIIPLNVCIGVKICSTLRDHASLHAASTDTNQPSACQSAAPRPGNHSRQDEPQEGRQGDRCLDNPGTNNHRYQSWRFNRKGTCQGCELRQSKSTNSTNSSFQNRSQSQMKTTRTLVFISSIFVLLNAPSHAFRIHAFIVSLRGEAYSASDASLRGQEAAQLVYYVNFAINFFLYSVCAQQFRSTLRRMLKRSRRSIAVWFRKRRLLIASCYRERKFMGSRTTLLDPGRNLLVKVPSPTLVAHQTVV